MPHTAYISHQNFRSLQTSSSVVVETTPWPSITTVATMNGISAPNFTMNATKFHITKPQKLALPTTLHPLRPTR